MSNRDLEKRLLKQTLKTDEDKTAEYNSKLLRFSLTPIPYFGDRAFMEEIERVFPRWTQTPVSIFALATKYYIWGNILFHTLYQHLPK